MRSPLSIRTAAFGGAMAVFLACSVLMPAFRPARLARLRLLQEERPARVDAVPKAWGAYTNGLASLQSNWGDPGSRVTGMGSLHDADDGAPRRVHGAPGVGESVANKHPMEQEGPQPSAREGGAHTFGSAVGRAVARGWGGRSQTDARTMVRRVHHPLGWVMKHAPRTRAKRASAQVQTKATANALRVWRESHMARAEARVKRKERDQEAGMSRLRQTISQDRADVEQARDEGAAAEADLKRAEKEQRRTAAERQANRQKRLRLTNVRLREMNLRRTVLHKVARARARRLRLAQRKQQNLVVQGTLDKVRLQAQHETSQAMQLRADAVRALAAAHSLKKEAASMNGLAGQMGATAAADDSAATRAVQAGRQRARRVLARAGGSAAASSAAAKDARHAEEKMQEHTAAAQALRLEGRRYKHEAARLLIQADIQAARAPRDLAVAARVQAAAQRLHAHVKKVEKSLAAAEQLRDLRQQQRAPELQREHWRKLSAVQRLAQLQMHKTTLAAALQESEGEMAEESDKAASDKRAAMERKKQAGITLRAARASEIEDEGRLHALERRWRVTEEQLDALDAVKPRLG